METLLVGNSSLRDVHFDGPDNRSQIRVVKKSGATFKEIEQMIDEAANKPPINEIVIVGGTTETMGDPTADDVRNEVSRLLRTVVHLPNTITQKCSLVQGFLMEMLCYGLGSEKMPDANLYTLDNLHNQANYHI